MKIKLLVAAVVILSALAFNGSFITAPVGKAAMETDHPYLVQGYEQVHSIGDVTKFFAGSWLHTGAGGYRPLSSIWHIGQINILQAHGWHAAAWLTFGLLVACCLLTAAIAYTLTKLPHLATLAGVLASAVPVWSSTVHPAWVLWHPISSDLLTISLVQGALLFFLLWRETPKRRYLAGVYALSLLAMMAKEYGYIVPLMLMALSALPATVTHRRAVIHAGVLSIASVAFFVFRNAVVPNPRNPPTPRTQAAYEAFTAWLPPSLNEMLAGSLMYGLFGLACYGAIAGAVWALWRHWAAVKAYCQQEAVRVQVWRVGVAWALVQLSVAPFLGFPIVGHYTIPPIFFKSLFVVVVLQALRVLAPSPFSLPRRVRATPTESSPAPHGLTI